MRNKSQNKKFKIIISVVAIVLFLGLAANFGLLPASLYGGDEENGFAGYITTIQTSLSGSTTTQFTESTIDHIDLSITNRNGFTDSKTLWIKPTGSTLTNYPKKIVLEYDSAMQIDFDDVRFFQDGTKLDYWLEEKTDSVSATFWVEVPTINTDSGACIDIKFGNPNLESESDGNAVFLMFDDFSGSSIDSNIWTVGGGTFNVAGDTITYTGDSYADSIFTISNGHTIEFKSKLDNSVYNYAGFVVGSYSSRFYGWFATEYPELQFLSVTGSLERTNYGTSDEQYHIFRIDRIADDCRNAYIDNVFEGTHTSAISGDGNIRFGGNSGAIFETDWIFVRQYTPIEPDYIILDNIPATQTNYKEITINPSADGTLYFYQVFFDDLPYTAAMQNDFDDLRFTYDDSPIPHFIDSFVSGTSADIFVLVPVIDSSTGATIRMYYGDGTASNENNRNTFEFYETFDGDSLDLTKWVKGSNAITSISNSELTLTSSDTDNGINSVDTFSVGHTIYTRFKFVNAHWGRAGFVSTNNGGNSACVLRHDGVSYVETALTQPTRTHSTITDVNNVYRNAKIDFISTSKVDFNIDGSTYTHTTNIYNGDLKAGATIWQQSIVIDYFIITKYTPNPPTYSIGSEQASTITTTSDFTIDGQTYILGSETVNYELSGGTLSSFDIITDSFDYDFIAAIHHTGTPTITAENATEGTLTATFTPTLAIEEGYINTKFSENLTFEYPSVIATIDGESVNATLTNNTVSTELLSLDASLHTLNVTISNVPPSETPTVPSSSGGGGSTYVPPVVEEETTEELNENIVTSSLDSEQLDKKELFDILNDNTQAQLILVIFVILGIFGTILYKNRGKK